MLQSQFPLPGTVSRPGHGHDLSCHLLVGRSKAVGGGDGPQAPRSPTERKEWVYEVDLDSYQHLDVGPSRIRQPVSGWIGRLQPGSVEEVCSEGRREKWWRCLLLLLCCWLAASFCRDCVAASATPLLPLHGEEDPAMLPLSLSPPPARPRPRSNCTLQPQLPCPALPSPGRDCRLDTALLLADIICFFCFFKNLLPFHPRTILLCISWLLPLRTASKRVPLLSPD